MRGNRGFVGKYKEMWGLQLEMSSERRRQANLGGGGGGGVRGGG